MLSATAAEGLNFSGVPGRLKSAGVEDRGRSTGKLNYSNVIRGIGSNLSRLGAAFYWVARPNTPVQRYRSWFEYESAGRLTP